MCSLFQRSGAMAGFCRFGAQDRRETEEMHGNVQTAVGYLAHQLRTDNM